MSDKNNTAARQGLLHFIDWLIDNLYLVTFDSNNEQHYIQ